MAHCIYWRDIGYNFQHYSHVHMGVIIASSLTSAPVSQIKLPWADPEGGRGSGPLRKITSGYRFS